MCIHKYTLEPLSCFCVLLPGLTRSTKWQRNDTEATNTDDFRLSPRVFSQNLLEETGAVETVVGVLYDVLFPDDNDGDDQMRDSDSDREVVQTTESAIDSDQSPSLSLESGQPTSTNAVTQRSDVSVVDTDVGESPTTSSTPTTPIHSARASTAHPLTAAATTNDSVGLAPDVPNVFSSDTVRPSSELRTAAVLFPILEIVYELSSHQRCAEVLVLSGALHYVVFALESVTDPQDELLPLCLVVLWNVLELSHEKMSTLGKCTSRRELLVHFRLRNAAYFLSNAFALETLLHVFELLLARGYRPQDKEMRNECLMVLHLLARRRRSLDFFYSTGVTASLLSYATAAETPTKPHKTKKKNLTATTVKTNGRSHVTNPTSSACIDLPSSARAVAINADLHHYATNCDEDFEFKQILWYLIAEVAGDHDANRRELVQFRFTETLLFYATAGWTDSDSNDSAARRHTSVQRQVLQTTALSVLNHLAPSILEHLYELNGHERLLEFLQRSVLQSDETLTAAWLLMVQIAPAVPVWQSELGRIGAVEAAVAAFGAPPSRHTFGIRRHALLACATMCRDHDANRQRFHAAHGVHTVLQHVEFDPSHAVLEDNIVIATIDAVRSCIVGNAASECTFVEEEGVAKLLTVLARVPFQAVKNQVLAALAEVCVNPAATPSFLAWRSDQPETNNFTATQLLMRIYAAEDAAKELRTKTASSDTEVVALENARHDAFQSIASCRHPFLVPTKGVESDGFEPDESVSTERPQSPAFARLKAALKAAQTASKRSADGWRAQRGQRRSLLELLDTESHPELNVRAKIHAVLANVSFAPCDDVSSDRLTTREQVLLEVAKEYPTFQVGEMWQNVQLALYAEGVRPVYADALHIRRHIEHAYNASVCTKLAQTELLAGATERDAAVEDAFLQRLLLQKHQDEQAETFYRASRRQNSTLTLHLDAKRTRLEFLRRQDPIAFAAYENTSSSGAGSATQLRDPAPACDYSDLNSLEQKEAELRGRLGTLSQRK